MDPSNEVRYSKSILSNEARETLTSRLAHTHRPGHVPNHRAVSQALPLGEAATRPSLVAQLPLLCASKRLEPPRPHILHGPCRQARPSLVDIGCTSPGLNAGSSLAAQAACAARNEGSHSSRTAGAEAWRCTSRLNGACRAAASQTTRRSPTVPAAPSAHQSLTGSRLMVGREGRRDVAAEPVGLEGVIELAHRRG